MFTKLISFLGTTALVSSSFIACVGVDDSSISDEPPAEAAQAIPPPARAQIPRSVQPGIDAIGSVAHIRCGGVIAISCPDGYVCVDDPTDDCNPYKGDSDCVGICVGGPNPPQGGNGQALSTAHQETRTRGDQLR